MAEEKEKAVKKQTAQPTKYPASEIAAAADKLFEKKYTKSLVLTALRSKGLEAVTIEEAQKMVKEFANQKVSEEH